EADPSAANECRQNLHHRLRKRRLRHILAFRNRGWKVAGRKRQHQRGQPELAPRLHTKRGLRTPSCSVVVSESGHRPLHLARSRVYSGIEIRFDNLCQAAYTSRPRPCSPCLHLWGDLWPCRYLAVVLNNMSVSEET